MTGHVLGSAITLAHGGGGQAMRRLVERLLLPMFDNPLLAPLEDQARIALGDMPAGGRLAFTTDSYVVDPLFFPGGDIGCLAVNGTVNDLAVGGAMPRYLSCALIIEEGLPLMTLERVLSSMRAAAERAGVQIVTGDTKVVPRGAADKLFINTSGIGFIPPGVSLAATQARPGDAILVSGYIGDHGTAILKAREGLRFDADIVSDTRALTSLMQALLRVCPDARCARDATRGGVAGVLSEIAAASGVALVIDESRLPVREPVRAITEILGLDPLHLANEGVFVTVVPPETADAVVDALRAVAGGSEAAVIGRVAAGVAGRVEIVGAFGGRRLLDRPESEPLPRIC